MRIWYRALVAVMVAAATVCTAAVACLGFELWQAAEDQEMVCEGEFFEWSNGVYTASGEWTNGALQRMVIEKANDARIEP